MRSEVSPVSQYSRRVTPHTSVAMDLMADLDVDTEYPPRTSDPRSVSPWNSVLLCKPVCMPIGQQEVPDL